MPRTDRTLVVDASAVVTIISTADGFSAVPRVRFVAPPLLWSEVTSVLHRAVVRRQVSADFGRQALERLGGVPVEPVGHPELHVTAWRIADALDWSKTYDAEYVALAQILGCGLVTVDERQRRAASKLVPTLSLVDLVESSD